MKISQSLKSEFLIPDDISYLNCAYMSPLSKATVEAGKKAVELKAHPYKIKPDDFFETVELIRTEFAKLIHGSAEDVAVIPSVSYGIAMLAKNIELSPGDEIIVIEEQFPSNIYSWIRLAKNNGAELTVIKSPETNEKRGMAWNEKILSAISPKTKVVTMGIVHWSDGTLFNLSAIRKKTAKCGSLLLLDGTQAIGALPFNVNEIKPDALIVAGYKWLMCPYATGFAWLGEYFKDGIPLEESWINRKGSSNFAGLVKYQDEFASGARRFDMGEKSNFALNPMVLTALRQVNEWGPENIQNYVSSISEQPVRELISRGFWVEDKEFRGSHLFGVRVPPGTDLELIRQKCETQNVFVSIRGSAIRVAPHIYNDAHDFEKLIQSLS